LTFNVCSAIAHQTSVFFAVIELIDREALRFSRLSLACADDLLGGLRP
jgi:hypothetical protein